MACTWDRGENLDTAARLIREAAGQGAQVVLPPELFPMRFFALMDWTSEYFALSETLEGETVTAMRALARELDVAIPCNFFERADNAYFNTVAMIDADGEVLGIYRKTHIPGGPPGCYEKLYTSYGDTGFRVFDTAHGGVGSGVCWDQWFPEAARIMCRTGAEALFYPTGIGCAAMPGPTSPRWSAPTGSDTRWATWARRRSGAAPSSPGRGGDVLQKAPAEGEAVLRQGFDLDDLRERRANWGVFRDRRPDACTPLLTLDGATPAL